MLLKEGITSWITNYERKIRKLPKTSMKKMLGNF
jgi:hypothetical protein